MPIQMVLLQKKTHKIEYAKDINTMTEAVHSSIPQKYQHKDNTP